MPVALLVCLFGFDLHLGNPKNDASYINALKISLPISCLWCLYCGFRVTGIKPYVPVSGRIARGFGMALALAILNLGAGLALLVVGTMIMGPLFFR